MRWRLALLQWACLLLPFAMPEGDGGARLSIVWAPIIAAGISAAATVGSAYVSRGGGGGGGYSKGLAYQQFQDAKRGRRKAVSTLQDFEEDLKQYELAKSSLFSRLGTGENQMDLSGMSLQEKYRRGGSMFQGSDQPASRAYFSPSGQIVDRLVQRGRGFLDPTSDIYQKEYESLTQPSLDALEARVVQGRRSLAAENRQAERQIRDLGARRGAARAPRIEQALASRTREQSATAAANLELEAGVEASRVLHGATQFMIEYGNQFAQESVVFAHDFVNNAFGIRDAFISQVANLRTAISNVYSQSAASATQAGTQLANTAEQARLREREQNLEIAGVIAGLAGSLASGFIAQPSTQTIRQTPAQTPERRSREASFWGGVDYYGTPPPLGYTTS